MIKKYRKKPVVIEAMQLTDSISGGELYKFFGLEFQQRNDLFEISFGCVIIKTLEGNMRADIDDYIIKGIAGEFYPVKNEIFLATYEEVQND